MYVTGTDQQVAQLHVS